MKISVQSILYKTPVPALERYLHSLEMAARRVKNEFGGSVVTVRWGDASPTRAIGHDILEQWTERFAAAFTLKYVFFESNTGHAAGQNRLTEQSDDDILVFANPDLVMLDDSLTALCGTLLGDPEIGVVDGKQIPIEHPKHFDYETGVTSWCSGAFSAVRRTEFQDIGMFDQVSFYMHGDDVDLSWRYRAAGFTCVHQPAAVGFHDKKLDEAGSIEPSPLERRYSAQAALMLAHKFGRDDIVEQTLKALIGGLGTPEQADEARKFAKRRDNNELVEPVKNGVDIAEFLGDTYGRHRW